MLVLLGYTKIMFSLFNKKISVVTHNGSFHADDLFACAALSLYYKQQGKNIAITRTRDKDIIRRANIVLDVGGVYDHDLKRYDHHQPEGAGTRDNGIPYASFGLIWKHYGFELCGNEEISQEIDRRLVQPIDAIDNGISISNPTELGLCDYGLYGIISAYQNTWKESGAESKQHEKFVYLVSFFEKLIKREIERSRHRLEMIDKIQEIYDATEDTRILEIPYHVTIGSLMRVLDKHKEVMFIVSRSNTNWKALAMRKTACSFENRKSMPESWAGKRDAELAEITGVEDALFCHNARWMAVAKSKEGAWKLAKLALKA